MSKPAILFVCLGNICRSPMAEGLARKRFAEAGIDAEIDSVGTGDWHAGSPPDRRAVNAAWKALVDLAPLRARCITAADFDRFDYIVAMDAENVAVLETHAGAPGRAKLSRLLDHADLGIHDIEDPYYGGHDGFDTALAQIDAGISGLIAFIRARH